MASGEVGFIDAEVVSPAISIEDLDLPLWEDEVEPLCNKCLPVYFQGQKKIWSPREIRSYRMVGSSQNLGLHTMKCTEPIIKVHPMG
jgi:hypothetical protein